MSEKNNLEQTADEIESTNCNANTDCDENTDVELEAEAVDWEGLEKENAALRQQLLRLKADFENFRRRSRAQLENIVLAANEELVLDLLPVLDNFERAVDSHAPNEGEEDPFFAGMRMVYKGLLDSLTRHGLEVIEAEGQPFDPCYHDAISMQGEGGGALQVIQEVQTGYLWNGKILRHAKVLVGQNEEEEECQK